MGFRALNLRLPSDLDRLRHPLADAHGIELHVKRDDLIHPLLPGNKFRKLKHNLAAAETEGHDTILTFGGAYSNHLFAAASAAKLCGLKAIGVVRGEEHLPLNPVLEHAVNCGMQLHYLDRDTYREKSSPEIVAGLARRFGRFYLIPEGGSNALGARGAQEIVEEIDCPIDAIACACGTGTTLAGLGAAAGDATEVIGFSVLKGGGFLRAEAQRLAESLGASVNPRVETDYHFGGYARVTPELVTFIEDFEAAHGLVLDPIYTGKALFGLLDLIRGGAFPAGSRVVFVHTGGGPRSHWSGLVRRASARATAVTAP